MSRDTAISASLGSPNELTPYTISSTDLEFPTAHWYETTTSQFIHGLKAAAFLLVMGNGNWCFSF